MPKVKWGFDTKAEPEDVPGFEVYEGPIPPTGVYNTVLKRLSIKTNRNGDDMVNGLLEIREPKDSPNAKYNGYGFWFNSNLTPQGLPYFKPFVTNGLGASWKDFTDNTVTESDERPTQVVKIGKVKIQDAEVPMKVSAKYTNDATYGERLENPRFLARKAEEKPAETWDDSEAADDDDAPF